jgi:drug/metabolite transporter (DMT)-like permease
MSALAVPASDGRPTPRAIWAGLAVIYVAWGATFVAIRIMDETIPPLIGAGIRFVSAGSIMLAYLRLRQGRWPRLTGREFASTALIGLMLPAGGNGVISFAELHVEPGLAALVVASVPLWVLVIRIITREHPPRTTLIGLCVGFLGVALLVIRGGRGHAGGLWLVVVLGAALSWAVGSWLTGRLPMPRDLASVSAFEMLFGGLVLCVAGPLAGEHWSAAWIHGSLRSWLAIGFLVLIGSIVAFSVYVWLLEHAPISRVATYAYVNPAVAVVLGAAVLGEPVSLTTLIGGATIIVAVWLVIRAEPPRRAIPSGSAGREHR